MNISIKYQALLIAFFASLGMSCLMSFAMLLLNLGLVSNFLWVWLQAWGVGLLVGFPAATVVVPLAQKLAVFLTLPRVR
jgi:Protein of unknown function (DUF2798)